MKIFISLSFLLLFGNLQAQKISRILDPLQEKKYPKAKSNLVKMKENYPTHPFYYLGNGLFYAETQNPDYNPVEAFKNLKNAKKEWHSLELKELEKMREKEKLDTIFIATKINTLLDDELEKTTKNALVEDFRRYTEHYSGTSQAQIAQTRMYDLAFAQAEKLNTTQDYAIFRQKYPNAPQFVQALDNIYNLAYLQAETTHTAESYQIFATNYPEAPQVEKAVELSAKLLYEMLTKDDSQASLSAFIDTYPRSPHLQEAKDRLSYSYFRGTTILVSEQKHVRKNLGMSDVGDYSTGNIEITMNLYDENAPTKKVEYFLGILNVSQEKGTIAGVSSFYANPDNFREEKVNPKMRNIDKDKYISEVWVSHSTSKSYNIIYRYILYKEDQTGLVSCIRQDYRDYENKFSFYSEIFLFENKTGEELVTEAPSNFEKLLEYSGESYLFDHYKNLGVKEGYKLKLNLDNGKIKVFVGEKGSEPMLNTIIYSLAGYNKKANMFIVQNHWSVGCIRSILSLIDKSDGKELVSGSYSLELSPSGEKIIDAGNYGDRGDCKVLLTVLSNKYIEFETQETWLTHSTSLDWKDDTTFTVTGQLLDGRDTVDITTITYVYHNGRWARK